ncbi:Putative acetate transporter GPR1/FUN34/SatP family [Septoria linicola]|uniref:Acetate transporter GPR1/FUN34/SatP family n=1 Tax=Septoria linicola TaxID=215465 RepID=A0A9Q9B4G2_9PEZI|nr:Putative acetate transporter GPR1/FUN34/SatP family [Septoria linicola]
MSATPSLGGHRPSSSAEGIEPHAINKTPIVHDTTNYDGHHHAARPNLTHQNTGISISPELFEKLYLQPKVPQLGRSRFANPTPMGLTGFVISTFTFSMVLMGFGGASGLPAVVGIFFFVGPLLLTLAAIGNFIIGNFFPMMATSLFAVFWLSFGVLQLPILGLAAFYSADGTSATEGSTSAGYNTVIGLYLIVWGFAFLTFLVFALKTNMVFSGIFAIAAVAVWVLSAAYFKTGQGEYVLAMQLQKAGGALLFVVSVLGWWIVVAMMAAEMQIGVNIPVGDLSCYWPDAKAAKLAAAREDIEKQG